MVGIEYIEERIHEAEQQEANGEFLLAYRTLLEAEDMAEHDIDTLIDAGYNPTAYAKAQDYARNRRHKIWWRLTEDEKLIANS